MGEDLGVRYIFDFYDSHFFHVTQDFDRSEQFPKPIRLEVGFQFSEIAPVLMPEKSVRLLHLLEEPVAQAISDSSIRSAEQLESMKKFISFMSPYPNQDFESNHCHPPRIKIR